MLKKFKAFAAPSEYWFPDPDTGYTFTAKSKEELTKKIVAYREQNGLPEIEMLSYVIDNFLCGLPENLGKCDKCEEVKRSWLTYLKGGVALVRNVFVPNPVSQDTAERRAAECLKCPLNMFPSDKKDRFSAWADKMMALSVPGKKVSVSKQLGQCGACSCNLRVKVFIPGPFSNSKEEKQQMLRANPKCWQILE